MENGYVVQGEVYAEPVLEAEVVTAEPIMGEVVGEVVPSATDHLPEALDGAPRLALVAAGSADALRFDHADVLRAGGEAPLSANGKHVGLYWPQPRNAWGHWDYIDLGCSDRVRPLRVKLEGPFLIWYSREHGEFAFDVAMWKLHEGRHLVLVKACAGNPGGPTRMSKDACGRDFVLHADGTIGPRTAQHLRLGVFVPKPPGPGKPCGPGWSAHQNIDMCGQGDVEIIPNWRATHSIEDLKRIVEQKGYSAFTVSSGQPSFGHAALKKFPYQLTAGHCKPITTCCNHPCTIYIWSGGVARQEMNRVGGPPDLTTIFDRTKYPNGGPRHDQDPCGVTVQAWPCMVLCPLSCLAMHGCADLVDCLTSLPCKFIPCSEYDPNAMNPLWFCSQAMRWAASHGQLHTVMVLGKNGATLDRVNLAGFSARSDAEREGHQHIVQWYDDWVALGKQRNCPALPF